MPGCAPLPRTRTKLILVVIDGLTPSVLEAAVETDRVPALRFLLENGTYARGVSVFPSLTPVCLTSIATGVHPDAHHVPHLVWYHRGEKRIVEYGSSFGALRAAGMARSIRDAIFNMNQEHLSREIATVYESLEDAGLTAGAINITCYRARNRYLPLLPGVGTAAFGPRRFFFYSLFESDPTGAPLAVRNRAAGSVDAYAAAAGRWLVTRDGFDFLAFYLSDFDFASHAFGPDGALEALERADAAVGALLDAAGGPDEFLDRYAVILCSDHGQTPVKHIARLQEAFRRSDHVVVTASNRAGMIYRLPRCRLESAELARRLDGARGVDAVMWREDVDVVVRRDGGDARLDGDDLGYPDGARRIRLALANPNAGEILVSAAPGYEFADLAGRHHAGGGSHGSLVGGDSEVPVAVVGLGTPPPRSITDIAPLVRSHFGVS
jgi:predicted AlkP superfamily pyrophosphatase or phosphodiesterase